MKRYGIGSFLLLLVLLLSALTSGAGLLFAQSLSIRNYGLEDGMPSLYVASVLRADNGVLWVGTQRGVARFNGVNFKVFQTRHGLAANAVKSSLQDSKGRVWFGHENGGISYYNGAEFVNLRERLRLPDKPIRTIYEDAAGNIWFGTLGEGIWRYDGHTMQSYNAQDGICGEGVFAIVQDKRGALWIGTENGICICELSDKGEPDFSSKRILSNDNGFPSDLIRCLLRDRDGTIWAGTMDAGLLHIFPTESGGSSRFHHYTPADGLAHEFVFALCQDSQGAIWAGTYGGGVSRLVAHSAGGQKGRFRTYTKAQGLASDFIHAIVEDRDGSMWFGTKGGGLSQLGTEAFQAFTENEGLRSNMVLSVLVDKQGNYWFGTDEGLTRFIPPARGNTRPQVTTYRKEDGLSSNVILALYEDAEGILWLGTQGGGVNRFDPANTTVRVIQDDEGLVRNIMSIAADDHGNVWFGTDGRGVCRYNTVTKTLKVFSHADGLSSNSITAVLKDSRGEMWFGTRDGGLMHYRNERFRTYSRQEGLGSKPIAGLAEDDNQAIWIATEGEGLFRFDRVSFKRFTVLDGLNSNYISSLSYQTETGLLWMGTRAGVCSYNPKTNTFKAYGRDDAFLGLESNRNAIFHTRNGELLFGTVGGAISYKPKIDFRRYVPPTVRITNQRLLLEDSTVSNNAVLPYNRNFLVFDYEGISLSRSSAVQFQYKLEGIDKNWSDATDRRSVVYPNLPAGKYSFLVRARLEDNTWSDPDVRAFEILEPYWQRGWFYVLVVACSGMVVFLLSMVRIRKERKRNLLLEEKVRTRTQTLLEQKDAIRLEKEKVDRINKDLERARRRAEEASRAKSEFLANVTHELRTPMNSIIGFTRRILRKAHPALDEQMRTSLEIVYQNSHRLLHLINEILDFSAMEVGRIHYNIRKVDASRLCRDIVSELRPLAESRQISLEFNETAAPSMACDPDRLRQILMNLLNNALKYTERGVVELSLVCTETASGPKVGIAIKDSGQGISQEKLQMIFSAFEQANPRLDQLKGGIGLGLSIARKLAVDMGGEIQVESVVGVGSTFMVLLPVYREEAGAARFGDSKEQLKQE